MPQPNTFDHAKWINQFEAATAKKNGFRELRAEIFQQTVKLVQSGGYLIDGIFIQIPPALPDSSSKYFDAPEK
jgi:hypothetical protein